MRKIIVIFLCICLVSIIQAGNFLHQSQSYSFVPFAPNEDTTVATVIIDTTDIRIGSGTFKVEDFYKMTFWVEADVTWGGMTVCTSFVTLQTGMTQGVKGEQLWKTIGTYTITSDSSFGTSGYDMWSTISDSGWEEYRIRVITQPTPDPDSALGTWPAILDSSYTNLFKVHVRGSQAVK